MRPVTLPYPVPSSPTLRITQPPTPSLPPLLPLLPTTSLPPPPLPLPSSPLLPLHHTMLLLLPLHSFSLKPPKHIKQRFKTPPPLPPQLQLLLQHRQRMKQRTPLLHNLSLLPTAHLHLQISLISTRE